MIEADELLKLNYQGSLYIRVVEALELYPVQLLFWLVKPSREENINYFPTKYYTLKTSVFSLCPYCNLIIFAFLVTQICPLLSLKGCTTVLFCDWSFYNLGLVLLINLSLCACVSLSSCVCGSKLPLTFFLSSVCTCLVQVYEAPVQRLSYRHSFICYFMGMSVHWSSCVCSMVYLKYLRGLSLNEFSKVHVLHSLFWSSSEPSFGSPVKIMNIFNGIAWQAKQCN